jgi:heme exporter protein D
MIDLGPHATFIWASYAMVVLVLAVLIVWAYASESRQRRLLAELESKGIVRRSARAGDIGPGAERHDDARTHP